MKKSLFLGLFILPLLSIFFNCDKVEALSFTVNNEEVEVTEKNLIYYLYSEFPEYFSYDYFYLFYTGSSSVPYTFYSCTLNSPVYSLGSWYIGSNASSNNINTCNVINMYGESTSFGLSVASNSLNITYTSRKQVSNYSGDKPLVSNEKFTSSTTYTVLSKQDLIDYFGTKYSINFYVDNELFKTYQVSSNSSFDISQVSYNPPENYSFSGWNIEGLDLSNITSDLSIYGTTSYVRPDMNYSEDIDSIIHELSVSIIGKNVPVEFDYVYTVMDFIILLVLVLCVIAPFVILIRLLSGRW